MKEILHANPQWTDKDVVVVSRVPAQSVAELKADPALAGVHVIQDDHFSERALIRANVQKASKVIVAADWANKNESVTETDAKTVMAAMTIEKLAPHVYLIAELLDPNFAIYLKMANVDEVIYTREYSRILLANAVSTAGIAHVIFDLLNLDSTSELKTTPFPAEYVGKDFGQLCRYFEGLPTRNICIGVLENTGNIHVLKRQALSEAQKSPEMRVVLKNLTVVKGIECNLPKLNPGENYIIKPNSMAIVVCEKPKPPLRLVGEGAAR